MSLQRNKSWNEQLVTEEIGAWHTSARPLYSHYMRQNYQELLAAGIRYFGTWRAAVEASGIPYDSVRKYRDWSKERIVETIQRLEKDGVDLSFRSMMLSKYAPMVYAAIRPNHFGSWKDALTAAGLAPEEIYRYRSWDDDSILTEIRRLNEEGADLSSKKMDETANPLIATAWFLPRSANSAPRTPTCAAARCGTSSRPSSRRPARRASSAAGPRHCRRPKRPPRLPRQPIKAWGYWNKRA
jgi:hypothetical protein